MDLISSLLFCAGVALNVSCNIAFKCSIPIDFCLIRSCLPCLNGRDIYSESERASSEDIGVDRRNARSRHFHDTPHFLADKGKMYYRYNNNDPWTLVDENY